MTTPQAPLDVFVASTPLQLISCSEARHAYDCVPEQSLLIIARPDNTETERQMAYLAGTLGWQGVETVYLEKRSFYLRLGTVINRLSGRHIRRFFVGNKASWIHEVFYRRFDSEGLIFVDDGLATVLYYHDMNTPPVASRISRNKEKLLRAMGIRLMRSVPESADFFSFFPLPATDRVSVRHHDFPVFRQTFDTQPRNPNDVPLVGFLGQPFGGDDRLKRLELQIRQVMRCHPGARIVYFMHRKERRDELLKLLACFPVDLRQAGRPIEVEVALSGEVYLAFYSFASTALFTLKTIFPDIRVVQIDDPTLASKLPLYEEVISLFEKAGVDRLRITEG